MTDPIVVELKDALLDAVRRSYCGDKPWHVGPAHLGMEVAPEAIALEPAHARRISVIHAAVCRVLDDYEVEEADHFDAEGQRLDPRDLRAATFTGALAALVDASRPVFAAYRSTTGRITEEEITAAWAALDAATRLLAGGHDKEDR